MFSYGVPPLGSFVYDDGHVIQLHCLKKIFKKSCFPAWKEKFCMASFFEEESP